MKVKKYRWVVGLLIGIILSGGVILLLKHFAFPSSPISNNMSLKKLQQMDLRVTNIETSEGWSEEGYDLFCEQQLEGAESCANIVIGKPTDNIYFNRGTILQEVSVLEVLRGKCKYKKIWVQNGLLSTIKFDEGKVLVTGMDRSFMQEDCTYLLFIDSLRTNKYSTKKVYTETDKMWFGCYNLERDCDVIMSGDDDKYNEEIEFYTMSERIMKCYNQAKRKLIETYRTKYYE